MLFRVRAVPFLLVPAAPYAALVAAMLIVLPMQALANLIVLTAVITLMTVRLVERVFELRRLRSPWNLRIAVDGITCRFPPYESTWDRIAEIRIRSRSSLWSWLLARDVTLISRGEIDFSRRAGTKPLGTVVDTRFLDGGPEEVVAAIRRFVDLPVIRR